MLFRTQVIMQQYQSRCVSRSPNLRLLSCINVLNTACKILESEMASEDLSAICWFNIDNRYAVACDTLHYLKQSFVGPHLNTCGGWVMPMMTHIFLDSCDGTSLIHGSNSRVFNGAYGTCFFYQIVTPEIVCLVAKMELRGYLTNPQPRDLICNISSGRWLQCVASCMQKHCHLHGWRWQSCNFRIWQTY